MKRICVYCGSSPGARSIYMEAAREVGRTIAKADLGLVYGGAKVGCMGAVADGALDAGGEVIGVIPHGLIELEVAHEGLTQLEAVESLHERKALFEKFSDAFVVLPGGHGSHDELFEALTWLQLAIHDKPICLLNLGGYYDRLLDHLDHCEQEGFVKAEHRSTLLVAATPDALIPTLRAFTPPKRPTWNNRPKP